ncbi:MAG: tetratricopeptide repeat protein [Aquificae bacterium]|nr:tetratricopeptide repeat protein [Aquificota bacterium]
MKVKLWKSLSILITVIFSIYLSGCATKKASQTQAEKKKLAQYYFKIGVSYLSSGNIAQAIYNLNQSLEHDPKNIETYNALGIAYTKVDELEKAEYYFKQALQLDPNRPNIYTNLGIVLAKKGKYKQAIENFKKALSFNDYERKEIAYYNIALAYKKLGNLDKFEEYLKKAIMYNVSFLPAYEALADYYIEMEEYDKAKDILLKAIATGISSPKMYLSLAKIYLKEGNLKLAKKYAQKAKLSSNNNYTLRLKATELLNKIDSLKKKEEQKKKAKKKVKKHISSKEKKPLTATVLPPKPPPILVKKEDKEKKKSVELKPEEKKPIVNKFLYKKFSSKPSYIKKKIRFYIQLGMFSSKKEAEKLVRDLSIYGYKPKIEEKKMEGLKYYLVYIGYFKNYLEASRFYKKKLKPLGFKGIIKFRKIKVEDGKETKQG